MNYCLIKETGQVMIGFEDGDDKVKLCFVSPSDAILNNEYREVKYYSVVAKIHISHLISVCPVYQGE